MSASALRKLDVCSWPSRHFRCRAVSRSLLEKADINERGTGWIGLATGGAKVEIVRHFPLSRRLQRRRRRQNDNKGASDVRKRYVLNDQARRSSGGNCWRPARWIGREPSAGGGNGTFRETA